MKPSTTMPHKILVTDDDPDERFALTRILTKAGFKVDEAASGDQAVEKADCFRPDLILMDVVMPGSIDGFEACRKIKSRSHLGDISVVLVSNYNTTPEYKALGLDAGADDFIARPYHTQEFLSRINAILRLKSVEKELRQTVDKWETLFRAIGQITMVIGPDHRIQEANALAVRRLGIPREEIIGKKCYEVFHQKDHPRPDCPMTRAIDSKQQEVSAISFNQIEGDFLVSCAPVLDTAGTVQQIVHIATDISPLKAAEKKRRELEGQLRQVQKLEAIGTLAGGIAHDFNNILSSIIGFTELSLQDADQGSLLEDNLQEIYTAGKRARELVKQILTFARQGDEHNEPVMVAPIVKEVLKFLRSSTPTFIEITETLSSEARVQADPTRIHQILMNLCTNAAQAMEPKGGHLSVALSETIFEDERPAGVSETLQGTYITLQVSDTGPGIPDPVLQKIFDPYFTTKTPGEGTGLGLATVQGIVTDLAGHIVVDSRINEGSCFTIYLPVTDAPEPHPEEAHPALPHGTEHILILDDEPAIVKMMALCLAPLGYHVTTRTRSTEAIDLFSSAPDDFDLIITDMTMPDMTGKRFAGAVRKIRKDIPIILCTGYSKQVTEETLPDWGINVLLKKPVSRTRLANTVRQLLDGESVFEPANTYLRN